jgi:type I restriction enzyme, S subunit
MRKGWEFKELGAVSAINYGYTESASIEPIGPQFLRITDIQDDRVNWESVPYCKIGSADLPKYRLAGGDIVFARTGATTGKSFLVNDPPEAVFASYLIRLRLLDKKLLPEFVSLFFQTAGYWKSIKDGSTGSAQGGFNATKLAALSIPVPSLAEQKRIVGILDEAFDGIATAKVNAEENLQNARALFESHLQSVFTQRGEGWEKTTLGDEIDLLAGFAFKSAQYTDSVDSVRLLRGDNIVQGSLRWDDVKKWPASDTSEYSRYQLRGGDVVLAMDRPWVKSGLKRAMISALDLPCLLVQRTARLRCGPRIDNRFLMHLIGCSAFTHHILGNQTGSGVPHISGQQIKDFAFQRPSLTEQCRIAAKLEELRDETQRLESLYQRKLAALEALKKSLLHQGFTGEL